MLYAFEFSIIYGLDFISSLKKGVIGKRADTFAGPGVIIIFNPFTSSAVRLLIIKLVLASALALGSTRPFLCDHASTTSLGLSL